MQLDQPRTFRHTLIAFALTLVIFAAITPTLSHHEFSSGLESLNVATALEIRRTGNWLVPTLQGELRINKPPLEAWLTAAVISTDTLQAISSPHFDERDRGYRQLASEVRSIALLTACLTVLMTFCIGRILFDGEVGLVSMAVMSTSLLFLRFSRYATTDVLLSFFVAATIFLLLIGVVEKRRWNGFVGGGVALALAMMAKGPMALLQSAIPIAIFVVWTARRRSDATSQPRGSIWPPVIVGIIAFIVIGLWWYAMVWRIRPEVLHSWGGEMTGYQSIEPRDSHWYTYFCLILLMAPWLTFFVISLIVAFARRGERDLLLLLLLLTPILVMSFFRDKYPRYLLPVLPAAAVITAELVVAH